MLVNIKPQLTKEVTVMGPSHPPRTGGLVGWAQGYYTGGREFRTNTQGLQITEEPPQLFEKVIWESASFVINIREWLPFQVFSDKDYKPYALSCKYLPCS